MEDDEQEEKKQDEMERHGIGGEGDMGGGG